MELLVRVHWDGDAAADFMPLLLHNWSEAGLGPIAPREETFVSAAPFDSDGTLARVKLDRFQRSAGRFDRWVRTREASMVFVLHLDPVSLRSTYSASLGGGGESGSGPGDVQWRFPEEACRRPGFGLAVTDLLVEVGSRFEVIHGGCTGLHDYGFGTYAKMANPGVLQGEDPSVLADHDWQVLVPPAALAKLDRKALEEAAAAGEVREFESLSGGVGVVARIADDVESVTAEQWRVWREALAPALVEHERVPRPIRYEAPPHIDEADWIRMGGAEIDEMLGVKPSPPE